MADVFTASTHDYLFFFTDTGKVYRKKGYQIPESGKAAKGPTSSTSFRWSRASGSKHDPYPVH